jgi:hypothetical protein
MNAGIAAYVILTQNTDVTDIVGVNIFPEVAEQETATPFIVYQLLSVAPEDTHDGPSTLDEVRFEFLCYADSYALAADLGSKVRGALDRVSGTYNGVNVESVQFNDVDIDTIDAPRRFAQVLTFTFRIKRDNVEIAQGTPVTGAKLGDLYDVDTTGVTDGQVIAYDAAAQEWQPADDAGGVTELGQLTDVQFGQGGPETGELLKYDGSEWTNDSIVKSEIGLGNVDNTSDANKPVSTATQTELNAKANSADFSNVDNTSDADKPVSTATQTALNAKADTSAVPTDLNDLSDVTIVGTPAGNQALIYDATAGAFKSQVSYTNRFEDEVETGKDMPLIFAERAYSVKGEGDGVFIDPESDTPTAGKVIVRKIYHKTGFITDADVIGDYTLIHTFADDTAYADTVATFEGFEDGATYGVPPFTLLQTWEEIEPSTYLLDQSYGSGAAAAYSTRQLRFAQTDCMVIRRASDSTTTTIGFDGSGNIDEAAIETFCTGTTCTVQTWKDQSGNSFDFSESNTNIQPLIYDSGEIFKTNGKPSINFTTSDIRLTNTNSIVDSASNMWVSWVARRDSANEQDVNRGLFDTFGDRTVFDTSTEGWLYDGNYSGNPFNYNNLRRNAFLDLQAGSGNASAYLDGVLWDTDTYTASAIKTTSHLGFGGSGYMKGDLQEFIIWTNNQSSNRTSIEENVGDYFTQNTPLLDTYSGAAAAYSLRLLDSTYTGSAIRVRRSSDNTEQDIGFNVFSELDTVSLAAFAGTGNAFVKTWYDQSGNSNDATQTTAANQPKIYDGTTGVVTENGKPAVQWTSSSMNLIGTPSSTIPQPYTLLAVASNDDYTALAGIADISQGFWLGSHYRDGGKNIIRFGTEVYGSASTPNQSIYYGLGDGTSSKLAVNGTIEATGNAGTLDLTRFGIGATFGYLGYIQEVVYYPSDESTNRTNIESNINTFYSIY